MILTRQADRASLGIEDYADLLAVRALPEFHFTDERTVSTATALLGAIGLDPTTERPDWLPPADYLFDYESWTVKLALERERFAIFAMTGMGKTAMQLEWARQVLIVIGGRVLIVAPLNICAQTRAEAKRFYGYAMVDDLTERRALNEWLDHGEGVGITNYEKLDNRTEPLPSDGAGARRVVGAQGVDGVAADGAHKVGQGTPVQAVLLCHAGSERPAGVCRARLLSGRGAVDPRVLWRPSL
jgi:hypothetical protein